MLISFLLTVATIRISTIVRFSGGVEPQGFLSNFSFTSPTRIETVQENGSLITPGLCTGIGIADYRRSGWPIKYEVLDISQPGCSAHEIYPLIFALDFLFFLALITVGLFVITTIKKSVRRIGVS